MPVVHSSVSTLTDKTGLGPMKIRVMLYSKDRPRAEQSPTQVTTEIPDGAREFDHAGKRYKLTRLQTSVHEGDKSGVLEADAEEW